MGIGGGEMRHMVLSKLLVEMAFHFRPHDCGPHQLPYYPTLMHTSFPIKVFITPTLWAGNLLALQFSTWKNICIMITFKYRGNSNVYVHEHMYITCCRIYWSVIKKIRVRVRYAGQRWFTIAWLGCLTTNGLH